MMILLQVFAAMMISECLLRIMRMISKCLLKVFKPNNFSEKIEKVMSGTLRLQTEFGVGTGIVGTGILYDKEGHILTNAHVVSAYSPGEGCWREGKVVINFKGGEQCDAEVLSVHVVMISDHLLHIVHMIIKSLLMVNMLNNFSEDKIKKVMSGTLRLQTEFEYSDLFPSKVGAGILYDKKGHIVTNAHVVSDFIVLSPGTSAKHWVAGKVVANFKGGEQCEAEVLSVDVGNDVALLKIPESVITSNTPCDFSEDVPGMGENFFVVGQPKVAPFYVKYGHVSDPSRSPSDIHANILNGFPNSLEHMDPAMKFLELDVMAGPGFSGGPLSTVEGLVFGVLHAGIQGTAFYGIPFAIIERALGRMFQRSPGDNVFCHLN